MRLLDNIANRFGLVSKSQVRDIVAASRRSFEAAKIGRLTMDMANFDKAIDHEIRFKGQVLRARAREISTDDKYARRYLRLFIANVIGPNGHNFQSDVSRPAKDEETGDIVRVPDIEANRKIADAWSDWSAPEHCTVNRRHSFSRFCKLAARYYARDGEAFIRKIADRKSKYGLRLQLMPPEYVDENYNEMLPNGNVVIMGVELNQWGEPVAYYIRKPDPLMSMYSQMILTSERLRVPADEMIHWYEPEHANQTRGFTQMIASIIPLYDLKRYEKAAVTNATVAAAKMGFFGDGPGEDEELAGDGTDEEGNTVLEAEPATFTDIGNKKFYPWDPQYPTQQHEMFIRSTLRGAASGLGVAYSSLANDYGSANYSSLRAELLVERRLWIDEQQTFIDLVARRIFSWWLESAIIANQLPIQWIANVAHYDKPVFIGPRWPWVDPEKDINAKRMEIESGWTSPFDVVAEKGDSLEQVYRDIKEAQELAKKYGIEPIYSSTKQTKPVANDEQKVQQPEKEQTE